MSPECVGELIEKWQCSPHTMNTADIQQLEKVVGTELDIVETVAQTEPDEAFARLIVTVLLLNTAIRHQASLLDRLLGLIQKLRDKMRLVARKLGASEFSIGVSAPMGIAVDVSFPVAGQSA